MPKRMRFLPGALALLLLTAAGAAAQTGGASQGAAQRGPTTATRPVVVMKAQSVADLERRLRPEAKTEDLIGGEGMELRVAVTHERDKPPLMVLARHSPGSASRGESSVPPSVSVAEPSST